MNAHQRRIERRVLNRSIVRSNLACLHKEPIDQDCIASVVANRKSDFDVDKAVEVLRANPPVFKADNISDKLAKMEHSLHANEFINELFGTDSVTCKVSTTGAVLWRLNGKSVSRSKLYAALLS